MGLYLCVFDRERELDGVEVGPYENFGILRDTVVGVLESDRPGSRFPVFILHSDCDGQWSAAECVALERELREVAEVFAALRAVPPRSAWQASVFAELGVTPVSLLESFTDVDGQPVLTRLIGLARLAQTAKEPILFQ